MLKTGIHHRRQLIRARLASRWGRRKIVSIELYPEIAEEAADSEWLQQHTLARFALANGTYKTTYASRFPEFDRETLRIIREAFPAPRKLAVHDLAVSDGRTSVEFFGALSEVYGDSLRFRASDAVPRVFALRHPSSRTRAVVDAEGNLLQIVWPPFVLNAPKTENPLFYPLNHLLRWGLTETTVRRLLRDPDAERRAIELVHPSCARLSANDPRFELVRHDIEQPAQRVFDVVRAMNILNPSYFEPATMRQIAGFVCESVAPGGLLVTGSNLEPGSAVEGSVFTREASGMRELWAAGQGSPARDPILAS